MSRPERIEYQGAYYHVMNRGRGREDIFHGKQYYEAFVSILAESVSRFNLQVHAYCLMTNHYHLLVSTPQGNLQRAMRHLGGVYTQQHNRLRSTDGSLFRGRYKAIVVDSDEYLLQVSKYIHLNPLEVGIVKKLEDYPWSSYPSYVTNKKAQKWLTTTEVYGQLTGIRSKAKRYRAYVEDIENDEEMRLFYAKQRTPPVLGSQSFIEHLGILIKGKAPNTEVPRKDRVSTNPSMDEIVDAVASYYKTDRQTILTLRRGRGLKNFPRKVAMYLALVKGQYKLTEIAQHFGMQHYGGVGSSVSAVKRMIREDRKVKSQINSIVKRFDP